MVEKIIEGVGSSPTSWEEAAIVKTEESVKDICGINVVALKAVLENRSIKEYCTNIKI